MKKFLTPLVAVLFAISCNDDNTTAGMNTLSADVGHKIQLADAQRWISNFKTSSSASGRVGLGPYLTADKVAALLNDTEAIGVVFHHATDDLGVYHMLVTPWKGTPLWTDGIVIDANVNMAIDRATAKRWADRFTANHSGEVWFHFFGINMFTEITSNSAFNYFDIQQAISDDGTPQLVLLVWNDLITSTLSILGKTQTDDQPVAYDDSNRCPPCAGQF